VRQLESSGQGTDVLVIGGGMAGFAAAHAALEAGASVTLIEKAPAPGGSTLFSGGAFTFAGTRQQEEMGIADDSARLRDDLLKAGGGLTSEDQIELYVQGQRSTYEWLRGLGISFSTPFLSVGQTIPRSHATNTRILIDTLRSRAEDNPAFRLLPGCPAKRLVKVGERVRGAEAIFNGQTVRIDARRGVVLATGGFAHSDQLIRRFAPALLQAKRIGGPGVTGDGIRMAWALGADFVDAGWLTGTFGCILPDYGKPQASAQPSFLLHAIYSGAIALNKRGHRFIDESSSYKVIGTQCLAQPESVAFQLFDQRVMDASRESPLTRNFKAAYELAGYINRGSTVDEAAESIGLDPQATRRTVEEYNAHVTTGARSQHSRSSLLNGIGNPTPLDRPPFYIYACTTAIVSTYAGIPINRRTEVLDVFGDAVPGLFAAGEVVGGFHGPHPMSGTSIAKAAIFGRAAGSVAAQLRL